VLVLALTLLVLLARTHMVWKLNEYVLSVLNSKVVGSRFIVASGMS
jgi:hypothetical protein